METESNAGDYFDHLGLEAWRAGGPSSRQIEIASCNQMGDINLGNTNITTIIETRTDSVLGY